jgi:histidinol-phosphate phosphatase family protein
MAEDVSYCSRPKDFKLFPRTARAVKQLKEHGFKVIVVTNQSGVGRGYFTEETLLKIHNKMKKELAKEGAILDGIYYCPHHPDDKCDCRKPKPGLVIRAAHENGIDLERSFVVGDLPFDIGLGKAAGMKTILVGHSPSDEAIALEPDAIMPNLQAATQAILRWPE